MHALVKRAFYILIVIFLVESIDAKAMTQTMVSTHVHQPNYQTIMINTLLLGAMVPLFGEDRLDPEHFRDQTPDLFELDENYESFWLWLIKQLLANPNLTEADIAEMFIKKHLTEAEVEHNELFEKQISSGNLTARISPFEYPSNQSFTVPGVYECGGGDTEQKKGTSSDKSNDKESQKEEKKSDDSGGASASPESSDSSSLQVLRKEFRPQVTIALERFKKKEGECYELEPGGYSRVYKMAEGGFTLVLKKPTMPSRELYKTEEKFSEEKQRLLNMSRNEKEILQQLKHENIVKLIAYVEIELPEIGKTFLLIMEFAGEELEHYLKHDYRAIKKQTLLIAHNIVEGLYYLHSQGIVWGDLKSENVMLVHHQQRISVRLIDMATCQTPAQRASLLFDPIFTPGWQAPELYPYVEGMIVTQSADVYNFGLICAMLQGIRRHAVRVEFKQYRRKEPARINSLLLSVMIDPVKELCGLSGDQGACSKMPEDLAIHRIKTDETFLLLMAALATRSPEWRPNIDVIKKYFEIFRYRPDQ